MEKKTRLKHTEESIKKALWDYYRDEYKLISFQSGSKFVVYHKCGNKYETKYDTLIKKNLNADTVLINTRPQKYFNCN